eukprot:7391630-Prymnesium_polylepis.4
MATTATAPTPRAEQIASLRLWAMRAALGQPPPNSAAWAALQTTRRARAASHADRARTRMSRERRHARRARAVPTARRGRPCRCCAPQVDFPRHTTSRRRRGASSARSGMRVYSAPRLLSFAQPGDLGRRRARRAVIARAGASKVITVPKEARATHLASAVSAV